MKIELIVREKLFYGKNEFLKHENTWWMLIKRRHWSNMALTKTVQLCHNRCCNINLEKSLPCWPPWVEYNLTVTIMTIFVVLSL